MVASRSRKAAKFAGERLNPDVAQVASIGLDFGVVMPFPDPHAAYAGDGMPPPRQLTLGLRDDGCVARRRDRSRYSLLHAPCPPS
jgi:hypothetical protein